MCTQCIQSSNTLEYLPRFVASCVFFFHILYQLLTCVLSSYEIQNFLEKSLDLCMRSCLKFCFENTCEWKVSGLFLVTANVI